MRHIPLRALLRAIALALPAMLAASWPSHVARGEVSLADDIIMAAQGKENAERRESELGRLPGSSMSPFRHRPGSSDIMLGTDPNRRARRTALAPPLTEANLVAPLFSLSGTARRADLRPTIERLPDPRGAPTPPVPDALGDEKDDFVERPGPPGGLTLDAAIDRLVRENRGLKTKQFEIPQSEADVLTAGLRSNPLLFYSADDIAYGSYSPQRPGNLTQGISVVYPFDYSGKRKARVEVARQERQILAAQYQDAVRREIDRLASDFIDVLAARRATESGRRTLTMIEGLLKAAQRGQADEEQLDDLVIERDIAAISLADALQRYQKAKESLAARLELPPTMAGRLELSGALRVAAPGPPRAGELVNLALRRRPDLIAERLGVERARADLAQERAERFSDAYLLYRPYLYRNNSATGQQSTSSWGAGVFASAPIFNRNQGNLRRAELNIAQARTHVEAIEREIVAEVRQAVADFENSAADLERLEHITLPAIRRKRDRARAKLEAGRASIEEYLAAERDTAPLVRYYRDTAERHRRNMLKLNTVVGQRIFP